VLGFAISESKGFRGKTGFRNADTDVHYIYYLPVKQPSLAICVTCASYQPEKHESSDNNKIKQSQ
jgi:hypothetical protein